MSTARQQAEAHLFTALNGRVATESDKTLVAQIQASSVDLLEKVFLDVPPGRNRSLAVTALEEFQMRAVRAVFDPLGGGQ